MRGMGAVEGDVAGGGGKPRLLTPEGAWHRMSRSHDEGRDSWALDVNEGWVLALPAGEPRRLTGVCWGVRAAVERLLYDRVGPEELVDGGQTWDPGACNVMWDALGNGSWLVEPTEGELGMVMRRLEERDAARPAGALGDLEPACAVPAEGQAKLAVPTAFGTLVAYELGAQGQHDGFGVDLVTGDMVRQVAEVSMTEPCILPQEGKPGLYVSTWTERDEADPSACDEIDRTPRRRDVGHGAWHHIESHARPGADVDGFLRSLSLALASNDPEGYGELATDRMWLDASRDGTVEYIVLGDMAMRTETSCLADVGRDALELASGSSDLIVAAEAAFREVSEADRRAEVRGRGGR